MPSLVLMYHRITDAPVDPWALSVSPVHFTQQLAVLQRRTSTVSFADLCANRAAAARPRVAVTFDDGYADNLLEGVPALASANVPATVFITTGAIGATTEFWWDELEALTLGPGTLPRRFSVRVNGQEHSWDLADVIRHTDADNERHRGWRAWDAPPGPRHAFYKGLWSLMHAQPFERQQHMLDALHAWASRPRRARSSHRTLTVAELRTMADARGLEIGAHSVTHPALTNLDRPGQQWELARAKSRLETTLGRPVTSLAYPHGAHDSVTLELAAQVGYEQACTVTPGTVAQETPALAVPRMHVQDWDGVEFERRLDEWLTP